MFFPRSARSGFLPIQNTRHNCVVFNVNYNVWGISVENVCQLLCPYFVMELESEGKSSTPSLIIEPRGSAPLIIPKPV
jgi:hypothetical protein